MFTGIVTDTGRVTSSRRRRGVLALTLEAPQIARSLHKGDSVAVNGVCLTAVRTGRKRFTTEVVDETLARTTLGDVDRGDVVNLELALRPSDRLGGHFVQGHVDGTARLARIEEEDGSRRLHWEADDDVVRYVVVKGSIALDGVSLTVAKVGRSSFEVVVIPHTLDVTTLGRAQVGGRANVEVDLLAKYVEKLAGGSGTEGNQDKRENATSGKERR